MTISMIYPTTRGEFGVVRKMVESILRSVFFLKNSNSQHINKIKNYLEIYYLIMVIVNCKVQKSK